MVRTHTYPGPHWALLVQPLGIVGPEQNPSGQVHTLLPSTVVTHAHASLPLQPPGLTQSVVPPVHVPLLPVLVHVPLTQAWPPVQAVPSICDVQPPQFIESVFGSMHFPSQQTFPVAEQFWPCGLLPGAAQPPQLVLSVSGLTHV